MKQTNNAIKFLMAQYRAIYKHAYIKGMLSAAFLTAGLVSTAASATDPASLKDLIDAANKAPNKEIVLDGSAGKTLAITKTGTISDTNNGSSKSKTIKADISLNITSGSHNLNLSQQDSASQNLYFKFKELKLQSLDGKQTKLTLGDDTGKAGSSDTTGAILNAYFEKITLGANTLTEIKAQINSGDNSDTAKSTIFKAHTVTVNGQVDLYNQLGSNAFLMGDYDPVDVDESYSGATVNISGKNAVVTLDAMDDSNIAKTSDSKSSRSVLGWRTELNKTDPSQIAKYGNIITISDGATLKMNAGKRTGASSLSKNYAAAVWGSKLTINNANLEVTRQGGRIETKETVFNNATINIANGADLNFVPRFGSVYENGKYDNDTSSQKVINGTVSISGGTLANQGNLILGNGGTLSIEDSVKMTAGGSSNIKIGIVTSNNHSFAGTTNPTLEISSKQLSNYINTAKGKLTLEKGGRVNFTDPTQVDLANFTFGTYGTSGEGIKSGEIGLGSSGAEIGSGNTEDKISGDIRVIASDLAVSKKLGNSAKNLTLQADNLTLGSTNTANHSNDGLNFGKAEAKNITFLAPTNKSVVLTQGVTLSNTRSVTINGKDEIKGDSGSITGDVTLGQSGKLIADGGIYTGSDKITISSGDLSVTNTKNTDLSKLSLSGTLELDVAKDNTITVSGNTTGSPARTDLNAVLDLSNATFAFSGASRSNLSTFKVEKNSLLVFGNNLQSLLSDAKSNAGILISGGQVSVTEDIELNSSAITSGTGASSGAITFHTNGGTLDLGNNTLKLTAAKADASATVVNLGNKANINAGTLDLSSQKTDLSAQEVQLQNGTYTLTNGLTSSSVSLVNISGAKINLGTYNPVSHVASTTNGSLASKLKISNSGELNMQVGTWSNNQEITLDAGTLNIGLDSAVNTKGETIKAVFNTDKLVMSNTGSALNVKKTGVLSTNQFTSYGKTLVQGEMTVNGASSALDNASYGVDLTNGSIKIDTDGRFTFGTNATNDVAKITEGKVNVAFANKIELGQNATIKLDYAQGTQISQEEIAKLKQGLLTTSSFSGTQLKGFINLGGATLDIDKHITNDGPNGAPALSWDKYKDFADIERNDGLTNDKLSQAVIIGVKSTEGVKGSVGSLRLDKTETKGFVTLSGKTMLNNASNNGNHFATDASGNDVTIKVNNAPLTLAGGGIAGKVELSENSSLSTNGGKTVIAEISDTHNNGLFTAGAETEVTGSIKVGNLDVKASLIADSASLAHGFNSDKDSVTKITNTLLVNGDFDASGRVEAKTLDLKQNAYIDQGALVKANELIASNKGTIQVGRDYISAEENGGLAQDSSTGYLEVGSLQLNGATLYADPEYSAPTTLVAINKLNAKTTQGAPTNKDGVGLLDGHIVVGKNSAVGLGLDQATLAKSIARYQTGGSLQADDVGAILYVAENMVVGANQTIAVNADQDANTLAKTQQVLTKKDGTQADLGLSKHGAIIINVNAFETGDKKATPTSAIHFNKTGASISAQEGGQIILSGDYDITKAISLFSDNDTDNSGVLLDGQDISVISETGLFGYTLKAGEQVGNKIIMELKEDVLDLALEDASDPLVDTLEEYYEHNLGLNKPSVPEQTPDQAKDSADATTATTQAKPYKNIFLNNALTKQGGAKAAENTLRLGVYAGGIQAALGAASTTYDSISSRMGVGAQNDAMSFADNNQGTALWLTPIYKNSESDGFKAQGLKYGVDMDLYGLALGADFTLNNGLRVGGMFNVGSGDADGQQIAKGVSNDFDYYGFGAYAGYTLNKLSVVADLSYTVVDNEVRANTVNGLIGTSFDTSALSLGITAQYALGLNGIDVVPHAGLRFTSIDMDNYIVESEDHGDVAKYDSDRLNVFSIPVGVTISKDIMAGSWIVKPSFDLTLTANVGDDTADGTTYWAGAEGLKTRTQTEVIDSFTYSAAMGIAAQSGNFSFGLGANYTGSSNVDEYGVSANARFVF